MMFHFAAGLNAVPCILMNTLFHLWLQMGFSDDFDDGKPVKTADSGCLYKIGTLLIDVTNSLRHDEGTMKEKAVV